MTVEAVVAAPVDRVRAVLGRRDAWIRTAVALGARVQTHPGPVAPHTGPGDPVRDGELVRLHRPPPRHAVPTALSALTGRRSLILRADRPDPDALPAWRVPHGSGAITIELAPTGPGTRVTVRITGLSSGRPDRARSARAAARLLLGIVDTTARAPRLVVAAAIVRRADRPELLVARRRTGEWELPGGKAEPRESAAQALRREIEEELGVRIDVGAPVGRPVALGAGLELRCLAARLAPGSGPPQAREHDELRWVTTEQLADVPWCAADRTWTADLAALLEG